MNGIQARRAAEEIWDWRQTHGLMSDRSIEVLAEIIGRHTRPAKAHDLVRKILAFTGPANDAKWREIRKAAETLSEEFEVDQTRVYEKWF